MTWLILLGMHTPANAQGALEAAYQKEYAYLRAEKQALQTRLDEQARDTVAREQAADAELSSLELRLLAAERQADASERRLNELDAAVLDLDARQDLITNTVSQASEALGIDVSADLTPASQLTAVFGAAVDAVAAGRTLRTTEGPLLLPDGTQVPGTRIDLGYVAAWGVTESVSGVLLPLGSGRMQLRDPTHGAIGADTAHALVEGRRLDVAETFLLESFDKPIHERTSRTALEVVQAGGMVAWVIVALGSLAFVLALLRTVGLWRAGRGMAQGVAVATLVEQGETSTAHATVVGGTTPISRVLRAVLTAPDRTRSALQDAAMEAQLYEVPAIERFGAAIGVVAAVAPLLGLLGTVTGMIATFDVITEVGTGDPKQLSGGIGEALITTQLGLIVAIPAVLIGNVLKGRADVLMATMERTALRVVNQLSDRLDDAEDRAAAK